MRSIGSALVRAAAHRRSIFASVALAQALLGLVPRPGLEGLGRPAVALGGPPASGLPWWTPIAVSLGLLSIALLYLLRHRRRRTPEAPAAESTGDAPSPVSPETHGPEVPPKLDLAPLRV